MKILLQSLNPLIYKGTGDANLMAALDLVTLRLILELRLAQI